MDTFIDRITMPARARGDKAALSCRRLQTLDYRKKFRVKPGDKPRLHKLDPAYTGKHESEDAAKQETEHYLKKLTQQQALLYAEHKHAILIVLQAVDAGGKDGTIKHVFGRSIRKACLSPVSSSRHLGAGA